MTIVTPRLRLIPGTVELARAELLERAEVARLLSAEMPEDWPPPLNDRDSAEFFLNQLETNPSAFGWTLWYFVLGNEPGLAIGAGGFKGPPDTEGVVEVGYSIIPAHHRQGFATEAVSALIAWALTHREVTRVIAHTFPHLAPSIGVLTKLGFLPAGPGEESGTIRFELPVARQGHSDAL